MYSWCIELYVHTVHQRGHTVSKLNSEVWATSFIHAHVTFSNTHKTKQGHAHGKRGRHSRTHIQQDIVTGILCAHHTMTYTHKIMIETWEMHQDKERRRCQFHVVKATSLAHSNSIYSNVPIWWQARRRQNNEINISKNHLKKSTKNKNKQHTRSQKYKKRAPKSPCPSA